MVKIDYLVVLHPHPFHEHHYTIFRNYDDGYTAAQQSTAEESQKLNTIVGVLAGIITILALALIGGGYYLHTKSKRMDAMKHENIAMETVQSQTHEEQDSMLEA